MGAYDTCIRIYKKTSLQHEEGWTVDVPVVRPFLVLPWLSVEVEEA